MYNFFSVFLVRPGAKYSVSVPFVYFYVGITSCKNVSKHTTMFIVLEVLKFCAQYFLPVPIANYKYSLPPCLVNECNTGLNSVSGKATVLEWLVKDSGLARLLLCGP